MSKNKEKNMKEVIWSCFHGEGTIECQCDNDHCENEFSFEFCDGYPDFRACQEELKDEGWISRKIDNEWYDFCCEECYYQWIKTHK